MILFVSDTISLPNIDNMPRIFYNLPENNNRNFHPPTFRFPEKTSLSFVFSSTVFIFTRLSHDHSSRSNCAEISFPERRLTSWKLKIKTAYESFVYKHKQGSLLHENKRKSTDLISTSIIEIVKETTQSPQEEK